MGQQRTNEAVADRAKSQPVVVPPPKPALSGE